MPGFRTHEEILLASLTEALEMHGLGPGVGLLDPAVFPQHRGGTGILVCCNGEAPRVARLLEAMGCMVRAHKLGVEAHLRNGTELGPVPPVPPVHVSSADSCSAAEAAGATASKRCNVCGRVLPVTEFSWRKKSAGYRMPCCGSCDRERQKAMAAARS